MQGDGTVALVSASDARGLASTTDPLFLFFSLSLSLSLSLLSLSSYRGALVDALIGDGVEAQIHVQPVKIALRLEEPEGLWQPER